MIKKEKESGSIIKGLSAIKKKEENNSDTKKKERDSEIKRKVDKNGKPKRRPGRRRGKG